MSVTHEPRPALRLFTAAQRAVLVENGTRHRDGREIDPYPRGQTIPAGQRHDRAA
jgi:hypothetical protein